MIPCPHCGFPVNVIIENKAHRCHCSHCQATMLIYVITIKKPNAEKVAQSNKAMNNNPKFKVILEEIK